MRMFPSNFATANPVGWPQPWLLVASLLGSLILTALGGPTAGHE